MDREMMRYRAGCSAEYLNGVRGMVVRMKSLTAAIAEQRAIAEGVKGIDYSRDMVKASPSDDHMPNSVQRLSDLVSQKERERDRYETEVAAACRAIDKMSRPECAAALEMHYIAGASWNDCAEELGYTKDGMMSLRNRALLDFYDLIPVPKKIEISSAI